MKTAVKIPATNFQSLTIIINDNGEYILSGLDGNGVAFEQTLPVPDGSLILFNTSTRNFRTLQVQGELDANDQLVDQIVREIV